MNILPITKHCKCEEDIQPLLSLLSEWTAHTVRYREEHEDTTCFDVTWKINSLALNLLEHQKDHNIANKE